MTLVISKPAVLLEGGPRHDWSYFVSEMDDLVRWDRNGVRPFPYAPTEPKRFKVHPRTNLKVQSWVWTYTG